MHKIMLDTVRNYSNASEYYNQNRARCGDIEHTSNGDNIAAVARKMLDSGMTGDIHDVDERWVNSLRTDIQRAHVDLECCVVEKEMMLRDIIDLKEGDVIPVDVPEDLTLCANGVPLYKARMGTSRGNLALQIVGRTSLEQFD